MKVVAIFSSARKNGFSAKAVDKAVECLSTSENEIKKYYLSDMNFKPCTGCFACRKKEKCVQKDDMSVLFDEIMDSDFVIFSSPIFCFDVTATYKKMFERLYPMLGGGMALGEGFKKYYYRYPKKKCMLIISLGAVRFMCAGAIRRAKSNLKMNGFDNLGTVVIDGTYGKKKAELTVAQKKKIEKICKKARKA